MLGRVLQASSPENRREDRVEEFVRLGKQIDEMRSINSVACSRGAHAVRYGVEVRTLTMEAGSSAAVAKSVPIINVMNASSRPRAPWRAWLQTPEAR